MKSDSYKAKKGQKWKFPSPNWIRFSAQSDYDEKQRQTHPKTGYDNRRRCKVAQENFSGDE
jgi:hypothetical protein